MFNLHNFEDQTDSNTFKEQRHYENFRSCIPEEGANGFILSSDNQMLGSDHLIQDIKWSHTKAVVMY